MHPVERRRPPISTRLAFARALDLVLRRDRLHSLFVPLLVRAPWVLALVFLPPVESGDVSPAVFALTSAALLGDFFTSLVVGAMLRIRARSIYQSGEGASPDPALECYARGVRRVPWLLVTEVLRNLLIALAASIVVLPTTLARFRPETALEDLGRNLFLLAVAILFALPTLFVFYRLAVATEAVVLHDRDLGGAFQTSFRLMRGHLERWIELILATALLVLAPALAMAALPLLIPALSGTASLVVFWLAVVAAWPIAQYAWAFFYLRLVEIHGPVPEVADASFREGVVDPSVGTEPQPMLELLPPKEDRSA